MISKEDGVSLSSRSCSKINCSSDCITTSVHMLKTTESQSLNGWIVWYVNYTLIMLLLKKQHYQIDKETI